MPIADQAVHAKPHIEGLLHLGALAVAIAIAYLGLDRLKGAANDPIREAIAQARTLAKKKLDDRGLGGTDGKASSMRKLLKNHKETKLLCDIAGVQLGDVEQDRFYKFKWLLTRLLAYPMLMCFDNRVHIWGIRICCLFGSILFISLVAATLCPIITFPYSPKFIGISFFIFAITPAFVAALVTGANSFARSMSSSMDTWTESTDASLGEIAIAFHEKAKLGVTMQVCPALYDRSLMPTKCFLRTPPDVVDTCHLTNDRCTLQPPATA